MKNSLPLIILVLVVLVAGGFYLGKNNFNGQSKDASSSVNNTTESIVPEVSDDGTPIDQTPADTSVKTKTYISTVFKLSFNYPQTWTLVSSDLDQYKAPLDGYKKAPLTITFKTGAGTNGTITLESSRTTLADLAKAYPSITNKTEFKGDTITWQMGDVDTNFFAYGLGNVTYTDLPDISQIKLTATAPVAVKEEAEILIKSASFK